MGEEKRSGLGGWLKAGITSFLGLIGGGILMYISPLVNNVIKPPKPVANFSQQVQGLTVTFQNRSTGGGSGWWDFGDGSALEPFVAGQGSIVHNYPRPGNYTAKLSLHNFLGDENERTVAVNLDGTTPNSAPTIEGFKVIPFKPDQTAPATYRVTAQVKNADLLIWSLGDDRPLEISSDPNGTQDRLVTLQSEGMQMIRLVAVSGKQTAEKTQDVYVGMADKNAPVAELRFAYEAVRVIKKNVSINVQAAFPANHADKTYQFTTEYPVEDGFHIVGAPQFVQAPREKDIRLDVSADKTKLMLSGTLVKPSGFFNKNAPPPRFAAEVKVALEKTSAPTVKNPDPVALNLQLPGTTVLPIPAPTPHWSVTKRVMQMELRAGKDIVWRDSRLPVNALVQINNRSYRVTAVEQRDQIRLDVTAAQTVSRPGGK